MSSCHHVIVSLYLQHNGTAGKHIQIQCTPTYHLASTPHFIAEPSPVLASLSSLLSLLSSLLSPLSPLSPLSSFSSLASLSPLSSLLHLLPPSYLPSRQHPGILSLSSSIPSRSEWGCQLRCEPGGGAGWGVGHCDEDRARGAESIQVRPNLLALLQPR